MERWLEGISMLSDGIAIRNKKTIEISDTLENLLKKLKQRNENPALLLIEPIPPKAASFTL
jgi:hypothetical protein